MTRVIALFNSKGGTGKTTATLFLSTSLERSGRSVEVWDADPQGSASDWLGLAAEDGPIPFSHRAISDPRALRRQRAAADYVLIDSPPGDVAVQNAVLGRADMVIVPTAPSLVDLQRVWTTLDVLTEAALPAVVLLTQVNTRTRTYRAAREALAETPTFQTAVGARETYKTQAGTIPAELGEFDDVAAELLKMMEH